MAKLRKMLGSVEDPAVRELMGLIETQSRTTLTRWAAAYTAEQYLPLTGGEDGRLRRRWRRSAPTCGEI